jgi:hypothetical protein
MCTIMLFLNNIIKNPNGKNIIVIITLAILCIISGTRYDLGGSDYGIYEMIFNTTPDLFEFDFFTVHDIRAISIYETGYLFLNSIIKTLGFNFYGFTLLHSIIFYLCMYIGLKNYASNFSLLIIVFLYKSFFYNTFISLRQSITIAIFFVILKYIQEKKPLKYFSGCAIAVMFHNAAIILFPVYFINQFELTKKRLIILNAIFIPTILLSFIDIPILNVLLSFTQYISQQGVQEKMGTLVGSTDLTGISLFHTLEFFLIMSLIFICFEKIKDLDKNAEFIIKLFLCLLPIFTLLRGYPILTREKDFFTLTFGIILGYLCLINRKRYLGITQIGTLIVCAYGFFRFIILFDDGGMMPYESYLLENITIFQ